MGLKCTAAASSRVGEDFSLRHTPQIEEVSKFFSLLNNLLLIDIMLFGNATKCPPPIDGLYKLFILQLMVHPQLKGLLWLFVAKCACTLVAEGFDAL